MIPRSSITLAERAAAMSDGAPPVTGPVRAEYDIAPGTDPEDGLLDVAILRARVVREFAVIAWRGLIGQRRSNPTLEIRRGREIVIETRRPQAVQMDGNEAEPTTRLEVRVEPGALQLVRAPTTDELVVLCLEPRSRRSPAGRALSLGRCFWVRAPQRGFTTAP